MDKTSILNQDNLTRQKNSFVKYIGFGFLAGFAWGTIGIVLIMVGLGNLFCMINIVFMYIFDPLIRAVVSADNIPVGLLLLFLCFCMLGVLFGIMLYLLRILWTCWKKLKGKTK